MALQEEMQEQGNWLFRFRGVLPIIILCVGVYEYLRTEMIEGEWILEGTVYEYYYEGLCLLVALLGLVIRIYTVGHTPINTSGRNVNGQVAEVLNVTGIYSLVRNPLYLGNFFMWLGVSMLTGDFWFIMSFVLFYWIYYERIIFAEEKFLINKFKDQYTNWAVKTPCFIPKFKGFVSPSVSFSWKKVVKKEKNGFVALLIIFSGLDYLGSAITGEPAAYPALGIITLIACVLYLVIKYIKHKTNLLNEEGR